MTLLKAILESKYPKVVKFINEGVDVNDTLNSNPPMTMLEVAIETNKENPSSQSELIVNILMLNGAKPYTELMDAKPRVRPNLPPLSVKGPVRGNIKTHGIAGLPRGGLRRSRRTRRTRKNRR